MTEDHFVTVVGQNQASLECPHSQSDDTIAPSQTNQHKNNTDWLRHASNAACDSGFSWLHSTWRPCSASNLHHLSSCCFPTSPCWAPVSHRTSPGSRVTNVQEAPRKKGHRSVGFATVMNPFEFSPGLMARRSYLSSLRCL